MKTHRDKIINLILAVAPIAFIFIVWQIEAKKLNNEFILPNLGKTLSALLALFKEQVFYRSLLGTVWRTVLAFGFSFGVATVLAFISRISKRAEVMISPLVSVTRSLPTIAIVLLLLIWTKDNKNLSAIIVTTLVVLPTIYTNMRNAFFSVDSELIKTLKLFKVPFLKLLFRVYIPAILPSTLLAIGGGLALNLKLMVAAEVLSETANSLGYILKISNVYFETARMMATVIVSVLIGLLIETAFRFISKKVGKWQ